jgi:catechol 2,3-dioxygenase-like lactoylglutathione lyase family enzyme
LQNLEGVTMQLPPMALLELFSELPRPRPVHDIPPVIVPSRLRRTMRRLAGRGGWRLPAASTPRLRYNVHSTDPGGPMRIRLASVYVDDQDKALRFYTDVLGFVKKTDIPFGTLRWVTVVSPDDPDGTELVLEPDGHAAVRPFKEALASDGIPFTSFAVDDVGEEYARLRGLGVAFTQEPEERGSATTAVFDDTCGNLIQIADAGSV